MKKFLLPLQNMVRDDLFSGSLAVWKGYGFVAIFCPPSVPSRAPRGEEIPFELSLKYTASWDFASLKMEPRGGEAAARQRFERAHSLKTKTIYQ
ncbi:hypothetical protein HZB94_03720 [Candidatus Falkowbacteria bacterium]|nr:hypothetical protein [Candidatus Falkowbacteria bacterium]